MAIRQIITFTAILSLSFNCWGQFNLSLKKEIKGLKDNVICIAVSPKGDKMVVGFSEYAALFDLNKGKKIHVFKHAEGGATSVNYVDFSPNGEFVITVGLNGKRQIWRVEDGKEEIDLGKHHDWLLEPKFIKEKLGLKVGNSEFDTYYCQKNAMVPGTNIYAYAMKGGVVKFKDNSTEKELKEIKLECNKNILHYPPVYFFGPKKLFITGDDNGTIFVYTYSL